MRSSICLLAGLLFLTLQLYGQIPRTISYQGVLCDATGKPKPDASYTLTFRLYDAVSEGSVLWVEQKDLATKGGLFSTQLGDQVLFGAAVKFDRRYWLSIQVGTEAELSPRIPLSSVGNSFYAANADTADFAADIKDGVVTTSKIADGAVTGAKFAGGEVVKSINSLKDNVTLSAGSNVTITPSGNTLTIASSTGTNPWVQSGSDLFYTAGKVGIGTSTPQISPPTGGGKFLVNSTAGTWGQFQIGNPTQNGEATIALFNNSGTITYGDDPVAENKWVLGLNAGKIGGRTFGITNAILQSTPALAIAYATGNVGIGTAAPTEKFEVSGNVKAVSFIGSGSDLTFTTAQTFSASNGTQVINVTQSGAGAGMVVSTSSAGTGNWPNGLALVGQATNAAGTAGVVGILGSPTSVPSAGVAGASNTNSSAVEGRHTATTGAVAGVTGTSVSSSGIGVRGIVTSSTATAGLFHNTASGTILRGLAGPSDTEVFTVKGSGNVGIGTTTPTEKLEVAGNIKVGSATIRSGTGSPQGVVVGRVGDLFLRTDGGAGSTLYVKESGSGTATGWTAK